MKRVLTFIVIFTAMGGSASPSSAVRKYVSRDRLFEFSYPAHFTVHDDFTHFGGGITCPSVFMCVQRSLLEVNGSELVTAGFWVSDAMQEVNPGHGLERVISEQDCMRFRGYTGKVSRAKINGVTYSKIRRGAVGAGTEVETELLLRTFHNRRGIELGAAVSWSAAYVQQDSSNKVKSAVYSQRARGRELLQQIVHSFRFLR